MRISLQHDLLRWFDAEKRDLPWRRTMDPYAIWVSEIMLQQTQVATVIPYYQRWMARFATVQSLADANEQSVLALWQGLGYYRRCRHLMEGARYVVDNGLPSSCEEWLKVPGVGRYTAAAISSIAQGQQSPLVDGNVERVYARLTGDSSSGKELHDAAWLWAKEKLSYDRPGDWNQALMELGAVVCKPSGPECDRCPLRRHCVGFAHKRQLELPTKTERPKMVRMQEIVWVPYNRGAFGIETTPDGDWWQGMWQFPRATEGSPLAHRTGEGSLEHAGVLTYYVTNHRICLQVFLHRSSRRSPLLRWLREEELESTPMPSPQRRAFHLAIKRLANPSLLPEETAPR